MRSFWSYVQNIEDPSDPLNLKVRSSTDQANHFGHDENEKRNITKNATGHITRSQDRGHLTESATKYSIQNCRHLYGGNKYD